VLALLKSTVDSGLQILEWQKWPRELNCSHVKGCFGLSAERKRVIGVAEVTCRADVIILRCMKVDVPILLSLYTSPRPTAYFKSTSSIDI
jgi:hypothetical protein